MKVVSSLITTLTLSGGRDFYEGDAPVGNLRGVLQAYGDGNLFGEPYGEGPPRVVWLHGWQRSGRDFVASASMLAERGVASVALDLPGFGASPAPAEAGGARHYAELVEPAVSAIGDGPVLLVGHSFGGTVATVLAARRPDLVSGLVLTGAPLLRRGATKRAPRSYRTARWLHRHGLISAQRIEASRQRHGSSDYRNARGVMREVLVISVNESYTDELAQVASPVTMLWGENDLEVPVAIAREAGALLSSPPSLQVLAGVGHMVPTDAPEELARSVVEALD